MAKAEYRRVDLAMPQVMPDKGCVVSPKCVVCPLPTCVYEMHWRERAEILAQYKQRPQH